MTTTNIKTTSAILKELCNGGGGDGVGEFEMFQDGLGMEFMNQEYAPSLVSNGIASATTVSTTAVTLQDGANIINNPFNFDEKNGIIAANQQSENKQGENKCDDDGDEDERLLSAAENNDENQNKASANNHLFHQHHSQHRRDRESDDDPSTKTQHVEDGSKSSTASSSNNNKKMFQFRFGSTKDTSTNNSSNNNHKDQNQSSQQPSQQSQTPKNILSFSRKKIVATNTNDDGNYNNAAFSMNNTNTNQSSSMLSSSATTAIIATADNRNRSFPSFPNNTTTATATNAVKVGSDDAIGGSPVNVQQQQHQHQNAANANSSKTTTMMMMNVGINSSSTLVRGINSALTLNSSASAVGGTPTMIGATSSSSGTYANNNNMNQSSSAAAAAAVIKSYESQPPPLSLPDFYPLRRTLESSYDLEKKISEGTYGEVFHGTCKKTGEKVAIKKLKFLEQLDGFPLTSVREVTVLKFLATMSKEQRKYFSVTRDIVMSQNFHDTFLVFDFVEHSLHGLLFHQNNPPSSASSPRNEIMAAYGNRMWSSSLWQFLLLEICRGLNILHQKGILHRDVKPNNILVGKDGSVRLCDFGLAVGDVQRQRLTPSLIALDFRPPEMLLGMEKYDDRVDVWSVGCVIVNVFIGFPPFFQLNRPKSSATAMTTNNNQQQQQLPQPIITVNKAQTELDQLLLISQRLGIPVDKMMSDRSSAQQCTKLHDVNTRINDNQQAKGYQNQLQNQFKSSNSSASSFSGSAALILPGRCAPKNDHFEKWLKMQHETHQSRLIMKYNTLRNQQQQHFDQNNNNNFNTMSSSSTAQAAIMPTDLVDLIVWMLQPDPAKRPRMTEVLQHPYFLSAQRDERFSLSSLKQVLFGLGDARLH